MDKDKKRRNLAKAAWFASVACSLALCVEDAFAADLKLGETIATKGTTNGAAACVSCHGLQGEGNAAAGFPRLAGLSSAYLSAQMAAFSTGERQSPTMQPFAKLLSLTERTAVAAYFSKMAVPAGIRTSDDTSITPAEPGPWLATRGRWDQGLPACVQCHGPGGIGVSPTFPPLAGQPANYISNQLQGWKKGARPPGPLALMPVIASKLTDADISAVAAYYAAPASGDAKRTGDMK
ncbi:c-type cytochrome [Caballeronia glebae]|uniref:c-type cytochrome n=1 Tax=Caballeronia glebae TaxID=1777143 RepID=UPI0038BADD12